MNGEDHEQQNKARRSPAPGARRVTRNVNTEIEKKLTVGPAYRRQGGRHTY
ncbi:MAG: hypothetical protein ACR2IB_04240 [Pyrinomonadaceae bacterium]